MIVFDGVVLLVIFGLVLLVLAQVVSVRELLVAIVVGILLLVLLRKL